MFETEIVPAGPPTLVRFLLQQLFVPSVLLVIGLVLLAPIEPRGYEVGLRCLRVCLGVLRELKVVALPPNRALGLGCSGFGVDL
jgi:hypothetical protein